MEHLATEIRQVSKTIETQAAAEPQARLLQTMPGIGAYSALLILSEIGDILIRLNRDEGLTLLLVEQKLPFARRDATRFCIMDRGRSVATGAMNELTDELVSRHLTV